MPQLLALCHFKDGVCERKKGPYEWNIFYSTLQLSGVTLWTLVNLKVATTNAASSCLPFYWFGFLFWSLFVFLWLLLPPKGGCYRNFVFGSFLHRILFGVTDTLCLRHACELYLISATVCINKTCMDVRLIGCPMTNIVTGNIKNIYLNSIKCLVFLLHSVLQHWSSVNRVSISKVGTSNVFTNSVGWEKKLF